MAFVSYLTVTDADLEAVSHVWGGFTVAAFVGFESFGEYGLFEGMLHEVSHAVAHGLRVDTRPGLSDRIANYFAELNARAPILGLVHEAHALAVEQVALKRLGLTRRIKLTVAIHEVWRNGMSGQAMPYRDFTRLIRQFRSKPQTAQDGLTAAHTTLRVIRKTAARRQ